MSKTKIEWQDKNNTLAMNELNVEDKVCKAEKGRIRTQRASNFNKNTNFLENAKMETSRVTEFK
jgi:hypothetical protein